MADQAGALTDKYQYTPYGVENLLDTSGNPFRYTGRRYDAESGLYYYRARYYWPQIGRFLETDPVGYADQMNLYAYVGNSPLMATDPSGMVQDTSSAGVDFYLRSVAAAHEQGISFEGAGRKVAATDLANLSYNTAVGLGLATASGTVLVGSYTCVMGGCVAMVSLVLDFVAAEAAGTTGLAAFGGFASATGVIFARSGAANAVLDVGGWMSANLPGMNQKLGGKLGQGRLPWAVGDIGSARQAVSDTLTTATEVSPQFTTRSGNDAFDIYSDSTDMTVRVRTDGTFDTLIPERTTRFPQRTGE